MHKEDVVYLKHISESLENGLEVNLFLQLIVGISLIIIGICLFMAARYIKNRP